MSEMLPWDYHPDLTAERITIVGRLIADGRNKAVELHDPSIGDSNWTLGCRAFEFGRFRILGAAEGGIYEWLRAIDRSLQLVFQIGQVPIRIYRGLPDDPTARTLYQTFGELRQLDLLAGTLDEARALLYRFAVETDHDGSTLAIKFVGFDGDTPVFVWDVPLDEILGTPGAVGRPATEAIELGAPDVSRRRAEDDARSDES